MRVKTKRIYKRGMAEFLVDYGCNLLRLVPDIVRTDCLNWVFEDNELLREGMTEYTQRLHSQS
jgi:hypothetical protein